jgi:hypothetical protein
MENALACDCDSGGNAATNKRRADNYNVEMSE